MSSPLHPTGLLFLILLTTVCTDQPSSAQNTVVNATAPATTTKSDTTVSSGMTIATRIVPPAGYVRQPVDSLSFAGYLRYLPLKPADAKVHYFDGREKPNQAAAVAVIDLDVGNQDLQQCADAIIRLRAEYLWQTGQYNAIQFHFTNGFLAPYRQWRAGQRIRVNGNTVRWTSGGAHSSSYASFRAYLKIIFAYAGTLSLAAELQPRPLAEVQIGDVFIQQGSPGHAVVVVDKAQHQASGELVILLAQSYMPSQDIHVLANPADAALSPWYQVRELSGAFATPEWRFSGTDLRHF
jgi:hypothetical protein